MRVQSFRRCRMAKGNQAIENAPNILENSYGIITNVHEKVQNTVTKYIYKD